jgi:hypothetical protein
MPLLGDTWPKAWPQAMEAVDDLYGRYGTVKDVDKLAIIIYSLMVRCYFRLPLGGQFGFLELAISRFGKSKDSCNIKKGQERNHQGNARRRTFFGTENKFILLWKIAC